MFSLQYQRYNLLWKEEALLLRNLLKQILTHSINYSDSSDSENVVQAPSASPVVIRNVNSLPRPRLTESVTLGKGLSRCF